MEKHGQNLPLPSGQADLNEAKLPAVQAFSADALPRSLSSDEVSIVFPRATFPLIPVSKTLRQQTANPIRTEPALLK